MGGGHHTWKVSKPVRLIQPYFFSPNLLKLRVPGRFSDPKECRRLHTQKHRTTDIATYRVNRPRGQYSENISNTSHHYTNTNSRVEFKIKSFWKLTRIRGDIVDGDHAMISLCMFYTTLSGFFVSYILSFGGQKHPAGADEATAVDSEQWTVNSEQCIV